MRTDIVRTYRDIHSWLGIICGLALFIAFYAGSITMFEDAIQRWATPPTALPPPPSLRDTPRLVAKVLAARPEAAKAYTVHYRIDAANPARLSWTTGNRRAPGPTYSASMDGNGALRISERAPSPVGELIDTLHQHLGLPFPRFIAVPIMGIVSLLYAVALVSGTIVLIPSLVKDMFLLRIGRNVKRMWLDLHNMLGLFSLPFHIVMALSAVVFALHDPFFAAQDAVSLGVPKVEEQERRPPERKAPPLSATISPEALLARIEEQAPGFAVHSATYAGDTVTVFGDDPRYGLRAATFGIAQFDARTGDLTNTDFLPGQQDGWFSTITSFFALHFGNYGGMPVQTAYFVLGMAGAALFYTGNLLWIESHRKRERKQGLVIQSRATRVLGILTVSMPLGCIAGIATTLAAAKLLSGSAHAARWHEAIYYSVFVAFIAWATLRGAARSGPELLRAAATTHLLVPLVTVATVLLDPDRYGTLLIDGTALVAAAILWFVARRAASRAASLPRDSVWYAGWRREEASPDSGATMEVSW